MPEVVQILRRAFDIHIAGIPIAIHRHALGTPVAPDAEFGVTEPIRIRMGFQGFERRLEIVHTTSPFLISKSFPVQANGPLGACRNGSCFSHLYRLKRRISSSPGLRLRR